MTTREEVVVLATIAGMSPGTAMELLKKVSSNRLQKFN